jgi:hypothetical protein
MKTNTMETLQAFADSHNLRIVPSRELKRRIYTIVRNENEILLSLEATTLLGCKWFISKAYEGYKGSLYVRQITPAFLAKLDITAQAYNTNNN